MIINKKGFTMQAGVKHFGFTLAEVLITLSIIGVVAALTIPSLLANVSDKTYSAKRKGVETRLAQAIAQLDALNSYIAKPPEGSTIDPVEYSVKNSSMNFVTEGLSKVFKITNICEFDSFSACDFTDRFTRWDSNTKYNTATYRNLSNWQANNSADNMGGPLSDAVALRTKNGESMLLYYNPYCIAEQTVSEGGSKNWRKEVCAWLLIDLDGAKKGPNIIGRDIHAGIVLYPDIPYVSVPFTQANTNTGASNASFDTDKTKTSEYYCSTYAPIGFPKGSLRLGTKAEAYNALMLGWKTGAFWTSDIEGSGGEDYGWIIDNANSTATLAPRTTKALNFCQVIEDRI